MTLTVADLIPGDVVGTAVFVAQCEHPVWPPLRLVIWRMADGSWSHDALSARQEIGDLASDRRDGSQVERVRKALTS